jgi:hypothetical protein
MLRLDYISCLLTVVSTILVGRRSWQGWIVAGVNSVIICLIGLNTAQVGFIPANIFCLGIYGYNLVNWRSHRVENSTSDASDELIPSVAANPLLYRLSAASGKHLVADCAEPARDFQYQG